MSPSRRITSPFLDRTLKVLLIGTLVVVGVYHFPATVTRLAYAVDRGQSLAPAEPE
ncbi:hypothetical protein [Stieleria magnilauensis]|uniref:Uncharacterized protein n=1 Tax=Stieleria magnilauensis TaxID=2527963 RepID=A0ABX5XS99_9BACT|nr:hypothetical protein TBK1r_38060 [Planctomycetes bacterium TBK1r]